MMKDNRLIALLACLAVYSSPAFAQPSAGADVQRDLAGYRCMSLNLSEQQMMDPSTHVLIKGAPSATAPTIGWASAIVIVATPMRAENGYVEVLHLNGHLGWLPRQFVKAWKNPGGNGQKCYPAVMTNGRIGFDFR